MNKPLNHTQIIYMNSVKER